MIDIAHETVLSLTEASRLLPRRRGGKHPHVSTLYRWASVGLDGVRLDTIRIGGTLCTSIRALQRFFEAISGIGKSHDSSSNDARVRAVDSAKRELEQEGIKG